MHTLTTKFLGALVAMLATSAAAQAPTPPAGTTQGFFRPSPDPAITAFRPLPAPGAPVPASPQPPAPAQASVPAPAPDPQVEARLQAEALSRYRLETQMDRIEAANLNTIAQAQAEVRPPVIASPLNGTAPIMSPLDGTAPIVSPISR